MAALSALIPIFGIPSLFRLARPDSLWAKLYDEKKLARARERFPEPWLPAKIVDHRRDRKAERKDDEAPEQAAPAPERVGSGKTR